MALTYSASAWRLEMVLRISATCSGPVRQQPPMRTAPFEIQSFTSSCQSSSAPQEDCDQICSLASYDSPLQTWSASVSGVEPVDGSLIPVGIDDQWQRRDRANTLEQWRHELRWRAVDTDGKNLLLPFEIANDLFDEFSVALRRYAVNCTIEPHRTNML